ncbi:uncharacterized protein V6R79_021148 [Siganus canaliculatus]
MFNPHIHQQQQQQQQQFHQHLRQLQQLFHQQPPPPPPPQPPPGHHVPHHHHQTPRAIPVPPQTAPPPRMVNLCQATQTTIIAPNPMLQGALLMQQMQGNMRNFGMGGQQFRQFFAASARSSLLGPVPMGMAIKAPMMGFPAARPFHPHARYYNNTPTTTTASSSSSSSSTSITTTDAVSREPGRKRDSEQMAAGSTDDQPATSSTNEATDTTQADGAVGGVDGLTQLSEDQLEEPAVKKKRTDESVEPQFETDVAADKVGEVLLSDYNSNMEDGQPEDCSILEEPGSTAESDNIEALDESRLAEEDLLLAPSPSGKMSEGDQQVGLSAEEMTQDKDAPLTSSDNLEEGEEGVADGANKFYCYLCSITCHNQQNFRSHMNSVSHQQRMMEIQHMSNACLVTLLPRVQESLQGASKDGERKEDLKHWCATCHSHFSSSIAEHRRTEEHRLASRSAISSCTVCKKHFRTSQIFVEHLQSLEHRQKVEKLQEQEGSEALGKLTAVDTDGFLLEEVEEEEEETQRSEGEQDYSFESQDGWTSFREVTLKDMSSNEQHDPNTVYGSSFFVPVAGFICRLCNKFYHFESSSLHTHCKSLKHFEKLKRYREFLNQKGEAIPASLEPTTETTTDCPNEKSRTDDTDLVPNSVHPLITLTKPNTETENQEQSEPEPTSQAFTASVSSICSTDPNPEETASQASALQEIPSELLTDSREGPDSEPGSSAAVAAAAPDAAAAADAEGVNEECEEKEAPAAEQKSSATTKAKPTPTRRSGRAVNRR